MMKNYFVTGRYVILYYGFCVLKEFIEMNKKCVFACAIIKKRRYWTSLVLGKYTEDNFGEV